ncbi:DUF302 domain-containing protein [Massilia sp. CCM 8734]|uniref:DUF302 domain-containing protein n=1 Tax=Massilia sp. CCM 8734 TaxID=2609283 RepID=UPI001E4044C8|nr:DUF302 domain-containing protein [Massilia sp. CCM 8734]
MRMTSAALPLRLLTAAAPLLLAACGTLGAAAQAESGAGGVFADVWGRWADSGGDIAAAVTWERKVQPGVTVAEIEDAFASVAAEENLKMVGSLPLSAELQARSGQPQKFLKVYSYCDPETARLMVEFSPHMAAFLPCRISVLEKEDGLWIYTMNMDMLTTMGRKLPPALKPRVKRVRDAVWKMLERGARGEF